MATLHLEIVTPSKAVFAGDVTEVVLPGRAGELGVLSGHLPLMTLLQPGELLAHTSDGARHFVIGAGFAEVLPGRVLVLTDYSDVSGDIDVEAARLELKDLESRDPHYGFETQEERDAHVDEIARHRARIALVERATATKH